MEIERKFLVNTELLNQVNKGLGKEIKQGYFISNEKFSVRVRTKGDKGYITIKGATIGISRAEYEYEIPHSDALELLEKYARPYLEKTRYTLDFKGKTWEIDQFHGELAPLIVAEVELTSENETITLPEWITEEVSHNPDYYNSNMIKRLHRPL